MSIFNNNGKIEEEDYSILDHDLSPINDIIIPISIASQIKNVSIESIYKAINRGILKRVDGVTLESLKGYKVDKSKKINGNIGGIKRLKKKIKELEDEKEEKELVLEEEIEEGE